MSKEDSNWSMLYTVGSQVLGGAVIGLLIGLWLERKYHWEYATIICSLVGVAAGMYSMIREGLRINKDPPDKKR